MSSASAIDRRLVVERNAPTIRQPDVLSPLSVGNGTFACTVDVTGLQSFADDYAGGIPLCTQSQWGWHTFPNPHNYRLEKTLVDYDTCGRAVPYAADHASDAGQWLRQNPHRLHLGRIGFALARADGSPAALGDVEAVEQRLDLWNGILTSRFRIEGRAVSVRTCCHPGRDMLAVAVESALIAEGRLKVRLDFPGGSGAFGGDAADWDHPDLHRTFLLGREGGRADLKRTLDDDSYFVRVAHTADCEFNEAGRHGYELVSQGGAGRLEFRCAFSPDPIAPELPGVDAAEAACRAHWNGFWNRGGAVDFGDCTDPRAPELERRVVLSQYLMAIQCSGSLPPQETGLTLNSWYGKFHLEMHWWHAVHFALWDRLPLLERSLAWYRSILPAARGTAAMQGYAGARWPKMVGPDGREGPSGCGPLLIWQQPHPVYYAELCYRAHPDRETLERYRAIVHETAEFMAAYARWDASRGLYVLGPPVIPAQEKYDPATTVNPAFELEYWVWGLRAAQAWRERLGLARVEDWDRVIEKMSPLPVGEQGYLAAEGRWIAQDHPSLLAACGLLPGAMVCRDTMRRTLARVMREWQWDHAWGWDFCMTAMTAARLGEPETAVDVLLKDEPKNRFLANGHNYQMPDLPVYLPGNGGLLTAVAMMAAGWDGAPERPAPGFPDNGAWRVRWESLKRMP